RERVHRLWDDLALGVDLRVPGELCRAVPLLALRLLVEVAQPLLHAAVVPDVARVEGREDALELAVGPDRVVQDRLGHGPECSSLGAARASKLLDPASRGQTRTRRGRRRGVTRSHAGGNGGEGGIRTPEALARPAVFKTAAFDRSATSPRWRSRMLRRHGRSRSEVLESHLCPAGTTVRKRA